MKGSDKHGNNTHTYKLAIPDSWGKTKAAELLLWSNFVWPSEEEAVSYSENTVDIKWNTWPSMSIFNQFFTPSGW